MRRTPHDLSHRLRMSGNADDSRFPQVQLWLLDGSNFQEIECRWIEKKEGYKICHPTCSMEPRYMSQIPELYSLMSMVDKVGYTGECSRKGHNGEDHTPGSCSDNFFSIWSEASEPGMTYSKDGEHGKDGGVG